MWSHLNEIFRRGEWVTDTVVCACFDSFPHTCCFWLELKQHGTCAVTGQDMKSKENIIKWVLTLPSASSLSSFNFVLLRVFDHITVSFSFFITGNVYTYISRHMFLVSHSHTQWLWYSLSNGCWLKKDPLNLGGVFRTPPISRPYSKLHRM